MDQTSPNKFYFGQRPKLTHKQNDFYFGQRGSEGPKQRHKQNEFYFLDSEKIRRLQKRRHKDQNDFLDSEGRKVQNGDINRMTEDFRKVQNGDINRIDFGQRGSEGPKRRHKQNDFYFGQRGSEGAKRRHKQNDRGCGRSKTETSTESTFWTAEIRKVQNGDINRMNFILDSEGRKVQNGDINRMTFILGQRGSEGAKRRHKQNDRGSEGHKTET